MVFTIGNASALGFLGSALGELWPGSPSLGATTECVIRLRGAWSAGPGQQGVAMAPPCSRALAAVLPFSLGKIVLNARLDNPLIELIMHLFSELAMDF